MEKIKLPTTMDVKVIALRAVDRCIAKDEYVQARLDEGCGLFALMSKDHAGGPMVYIFPISPANLGKGSAYDF